MSQALFEPGEIAPHSQQAEEAVLGSVLINPDAYYEVAGFLASEDFFILRNGWIWEAMERLHERSEHIEFLTVVEELKSQERLDDIGGSAYVTYLASNTATSVHAEAYGRIVERAAIRRRMLEAAGEITQLAREEDADINEVIDRAEGTLFAVTEKRLRKEIVPLEIAISDYYDRIERLYNNEEDPLGVPSGFLDMDHILGGFQKSDLLILAARPGMGKTSLMLNIAMNAVRANAHVAFFSLEMSNEQLVQRLVSTETGINSQKLRLGQLDEREWDLFVHATNSVGRLPLYLDDTPALSVLQLRTKARRLHREHKIGLIVVDYLQLMTAGLGNRNENRVQEISYISRGLKELARELEIPILAGAQLSRAVEQRTDKRPLLSDLRESGCLAGDTLIALADSGKQVPIRDLVKQSGFAVWALNEDTMKIQREIVSRVFTTGIKPFFCLTTQLGRSIRATANHRFRTIHGWKRLDELQPGDHIAMPRKVDSPTTQTMSNAELALLGHLIGDGCTLPKHAIQYTTIHHDLAQIVTARAVEAFGDSVAPRISNERNWYQVFLPATFRLTHDVHNPIRDWLAGLGVWGLRSYEKFIPDKVFEQPQESVALFLRHLWATDGCIKLVRGKKPRPIAYYASSSYCLAQGVQTLLLRFGINARIKPVSQNGKGRTQFHTIITGIPDLSCFIEKVKAIGQDKLKSLEEVYTYIASRQANTNRDIIPREIWRLYVTPSMQSAGMTTRQLSAAMGIAHSGTGLYHQNVSRGRAAHIAKTVGSEDLMRLAESDVYWDRIKSIEEDGAGEAFDLTVPTAHNFTANGIITHNSIEQDADVVMFIYRDDVYNEASDRPNEADIIVAKHRNGPTGTAVLYFRAHLTQFANIKKTEINLENF